MKKFAPLFAVSLALGLTVGNALPGHALTPQSREYYIQAVQAERRGNLEQAEQALRKAISLDPEDYLNVVKLASILNQAGKPNEAASYYQKALNLNPQDVMTLYSLGGIYEQLGQYDKAEEAYGLSLQNNPRYRFGLLNLARVEIQTKKYAPAIEHYQQFLAGYPDHYEARRHLANLYLVTGQNEESIKQYDWLKNRFPNQFGDHVDLARALNGANAPEQALEELKIAYAKEGSKSDILEEMGRAHASLNQLDLATLNYEKAYSMNPQKDSLLLRIADLYRTGQKPDRAVANYQSYLKVHPDNAEVRRMLVNTYLDDKRYEPAIQEMQALMPTVTDPAQRYDLAKDLAYATQMKGDLSQATALYESLLADPQLATQSQKDLQLKANLAIAYHKQGAYGKAVDLYKQVYYADEPLRQTYHIQRESMANDLAVALTALGDQAFKAGDFNGAVSSYGDATLYASSKNAWPYVGLGNAYYALQMPDKAYDAYGQALSREPGNMTAKLWHTKLAMARKDSQPNSGLTAANVNALENLAKGYPDNLDVLVTLADAYAEQGNASGALSIYQKALALQPENTELLMAVGTQWQKLGNFEQAKNTYLKALGINDKLPLAHYNLGIVFNELGQLDQSAAAYKQAMLLDPAQTDSKYGLAITLEKQQKYQDALETYQSYANDPSAHYVKEARDRIEILKQALNPAPVSPVGAVQGQQSGTAKTTPPAPVKQTPGRIDPTALPASPAQ